MYYTVKALYHIHIVFRIGNDFFQLAIKLLFAVIVLIDYAHKHIERVWFLWCLQKTKLKSTLSWVKKFQRPGKVMHHLVSDDVFVSNVWIISVPEMDLYKNKSCATYAASTFFFPKLAFSSGKIALKHVREMKIRCRIYGDGWEISGSSAHRYHHCSTLGENILCFST